MTRILFICMGNICRSPTVEAVARVEFTKAGLDIEVASAGTEDYHIGNPADPRAISMAEANGYPLAAHRARQVVESDFSHYDHLLVMDRVNLRALLARTPTAARDRVALFLPFSRIAGVDELADPYYGDQAAFQGAIDLAREGVRALVKRLSGS